MRKYIFLALVLLLVDNLIVSEEKTNDYYSKNELLEFNNELTFKNHDQLFVKLSKDYGKPNLKKEGILIYKFLETNKNEISQLLVLFGLTEKGVVKVVHRNFSKFPKEKLTTESKSALERSIRRVEEKLRDV